MTRRVLLALTATLLLAPAPARASGGGPASPQAGAESGAPRITVTELKKAVDRGAVIILDVRDPYSYADAHIPGALLVVAEDLAKKAPELRGARKLIVTYCG